MSYNAENKSPILWIGGGALAYLSLGPLGAAGIAAMWWSRHCNAIAEANGWLEPSLDRPALPPPVAEFPQLPAPAIAPATRLGALDVPNVTVNASPEIHNHLTPPSPQPSPRTASPAQADRQTIAPDLSLYVDPKERMAVLLKAMAAAGFPLGRLLKHPFVWCYGRSQSGKTTIAMLLSLARIAMGNRIEYLSTDEDVEPLAWAAIALGEVPYAQGLTRIAELLNQATKGSLAGQGWVLDEMLAAAGQYGIDLKPLLTAVLMKGSKAKGLVIGISQADTSSAHGLKGIDAAWREERISIEAIPTEDDLGERSPSGRYVVTQGNDGELWALPEWMLTDLNQYGSPCPVVWMLAQFPELRGAVQPGSAFGSGPVQPGFSGSAFGSALNPGSEAVQALNQREPGTFGDWEPGPEPVLNRAEPPLNQAEPGTLPLNLNREEAIARIDELRGLGLNQTQILAALWGVKKGGSKAYAEALEAYRDLA